MGCGRSKPSPAHLSDIRELPTQTQALQHTPDDSPTQLTTASIAKEATPAPQAEVAHPRTPTSSLDSTRVRASASSNSLDSAHLHTPNVSFHHPVGAGLGLNSTPRSPSRGMFSRAQSCDSAASNNGPDTPHNSIRTSSLPNSPRNDQGLGLGTSTTDVIFTHKDIDLQDMNCNAKGNRGGNLQSWSMEELLFKIRLTQTTEISDSDDGDAEASDVNKSSAVDMYELEEQPTQTLLPSEETRLPVEIKTNDLYEVNEYVDELVNDCDNDDTPTHAQTHTKTITSQATQKRGLESDRRDSTRHHLRMWSENAFKGGNIAAPILTLDRRFMSAIPEIEGSAHTDTA